MCSENKVLLGDLFVSLIVVNVLFYWWYLMCLWRLGRFGDILILCGIDIEKGLWGIDFEKEMGGGIYGYFFVWDVVKNNVM